MRIDTAVLLGFCLFLSGIHLAALPVPPAPFHGIQVRVSVQGGVHVVRASYDGGLPVADGDVTITAPGSEDGWQRGRTDPSGRFAFLPDAAGTWAVVVDDGRGHRARTTFQVEEEWGAGAEGVAPEGEGTARGGEEEPAHEHESGAESAHSHGPEEDPAHEHESGVESAHTHAPGEGEAHTHGPEDARLWQLLTGLGLMAGITGAAYGYTARRKEAGPG